MRHRNALHIIRGAPRIYGNLGRRRLAHTTARVSAAPLLRHGLSYYWDTRPPTPSELEGANRFFTRRDPTFLDSAAKFRTVKETSMPEVAFLGRSNVGKSSLLNSLMGKQICQTSKHPGRTRTMNFFAVGGQDQHGNPGSIAILDTPGYGKASRKEWGEEIVKYLTKRKQLRRTFLLVDAMHGLKALDEQMLELLRTHGVPHQVLLSKVDRLLSPDKKFTIARAEINIGTLDQVMNELRGRIQPGYGDGPDALGEVIACSPSAPLDGLKVGVAEVRSAILVATGITNRAAPGPSPAVEAAAPQGSTLIS